MRVNIACGGCGGKGVKTGETKTVVVNVPAGTRNLMELRIPGAGHVGQANSTSNGDLYVTVRVRPDPNFTVVGEDLHVEVSLTLKQIFTGGQIELPLLGEGRKLTVELNPEKDRPGGVRKFKGRGLPKVNSVGAGDLVVSFAMKRYERLSRKQEELINLFESCT
jgi:DnaJ-class molecular chaperone